MKFWTGTAGLTLTLVALAANPALAQFEGVIDVKMEGGAGAGCREPARPTSRGAPGAPRWT